MAIQRNSIVCLGTGSGKTFLGVMLLKDLSYQVRPAYQEGSKRTLYLVEEGFTILLLVN